VTGAQIWIISNLIVDGLEKLTASPHPNDKQLLQHLETAIPILEVNFPGFEEEIRRLQGPQEERPDDKQPPLPF